MNRFVVDSSVAAKWFVDEQELHREAALALADACAHARVELHAPSLLVFELGNVLVMRSRRKRLPPSIQAMEDLARLPIRWHLFDLPLSARALELSDRYRLTFYDATFAALAEHVDGPVVTADRRLADALPSARVRLLGRDALAI